MNIQRKSFEENELRKKKFAERRGKKRGKIDEICVSSQSNYDLEENIKSSKLNVELILT